MQKNDKKIELLSPAGSKKSVRAAVNAGADAIYFGGKKFNARIGADNISDDELESIIDYCHLRGVKVYVTINTIYKEADLQHLIKFIEKLYCFGADALIVSDMGAVALISDFFPDIPIHASTQTTVHSTSDVLFLENAGFCRVILSRELTFDEIRHINECESCETEVFVHGALCVCYSGRCLMSSFIGGRSGNRGMCAQPCRQYYTLMNNLSPIRTGYLLSNKDLMTVNILDKIVETGVDAIKIEGRMKRFEYVYQATQSYRAMLDNPKAHISERDLKQVYNRGGSTEGYFDNHSSFSMMSVKSPKNTGVYVGKVDSYDDVLQKCKINVEETLRAGDGLEIWTKSLPHAGGSISRLTEIGDIATINIKGNSDVNIQDINIQKGDLVYRTFDKKLTDDLARAVETDSRKINVKGYFRATVGKDFYVRLSYDGMNAEAYGDVVERSIKQPITRQKIIDQLIKTGNTTLDITFDNYDIDEDIFIGIKQINDVRRRVSELLEKKILTRYKMKPVNAFIRKSPTYENIEVTAKKLTVSVFNNEQMMSAINSGAEKVSRIYIEMTGHEDAEYIDKMVELCHNAGIELYAALPQIMGDFDKNPIQNLEKTNIDGYLARTLGQLYELDNCMTEKHVIADYHFNISNSRSLKFFKDYAEICTISPELNFDEIRAFANEDTEITIYGKQILITTKQCPIGLYEANKQSSKFCKLKGNNNEYYLKDKTGACFPVITDCENCRAYILNSKTTFMAGKIHDISDTPCGYVRLAFTNENESQVSEMIDLYHNAKNSLEEANTVEYAKKMNENGLTYGHFYRGSL